MASFKGQGRGDGPKRRKDDPRRRRHGAPELESLESRRLLATVISGGAGGTGTGWHPTDSNPYDVQNGPLANLGADLIQAYHDYVNFEAAGGKGTYTTKEYPRVEFNGTLVGLDAKYTGDGTAYAQQLTKLGMFITSTSASLKVDEGFFPVGNLPQLAALTQTNGVTPIYTPVTRFVGKADNEGESAEFADVARTQYSVDGTGQKIGILSDSVNQVGNGLADSIATGDLPNNVQVLQDGPGGGTDEGRAMLENVHDVAPGAALAFASADYGQVGFANNIIALANAGSTLEADDIGYRDELYFQDSVIQQAVNTVTARGVPFASAAGNAADSGYLSQFREGDGTVTGIGAGKFMNFDPTGATQTLTLPILVYAQTLPTFEFDEPVVAGGTGITSQVNFYVLDQNNNIVSSGTSNNVAQQSPIQLVNNAINPGTYKVAIQVVSGPDPGHVVFLEGGDGGFAVSHQFGFAGGTAYTSILGHSAGATTISVGASPWFDLPPYSSPSPPANEPFSSFGTTLSVFNPDGSAKAPQVLLKPDITGPDGGNTSFFGQALNTAQANAPANPTLPGDPPTTIGERPTTTNLAQNLPAFFGTSAAVENVIGVAALVKQLSPSLTPAQVEADLTSTATALNGQTKGVYNPQAGFGLVNAPAALAAASTLQVVSISPGGGQLLAAAPTSITVTFNKPVNLATVAGSLVFVGPNGATVTVGAPVGVDNATFPTIVSFPIAITPAPGLVANGIYGEAILGGKIVGLNGQVLQGGLVTNFNLEQTNEPQVTSTSFIGRIVTITFSEPMNAATITPSNVYIIRSNGVNNPLFNPAAITVSSLPGATLTYNPNLLTATIDLTNVPQSSLPTDHYGLVATAAVTDLVGNHLNGAFNGVFPSGVFPIVPTGTNFLQDLGVVQLPAPIISYLALAPSSDSGISGDNNTNVTRPSFVGQVTARFPSSLAGLIVYAEFNGIAHPGVARGGLDLAVGAGGRGFTGHFDVQVVTDALGRFSIPYPAGIASLPEGENRVRVLVVGQADTPPFPGYSAVQDSAFRIDDTRPFVGNPDGSQPSTIAENAQINNLSTLSLNVLDPVNPQTLGDPFAVDPRLAIPALDPTAVANVANYLLYRTTSATTAVDESSFIKTANFVSTSARTLSSDPFTGRIDLTFGPGLPQGHYFLLVLGSDSGFGHGLTDAAGNGLAANAAGSASNSPGNFQLDFNLQPTPTYITGYTAYGADPNTGNQYGEQTGPRASYEIPLTGQTANLPAPPTAFTLDFSNTLTDFGNLATADQYYTNAVQLARSAVAVNGGLSGPTGTFGTLGITNTLNGYSLVPGLSVQLINSIPGAVAGQVGFENRLLITLPSGFSLPSDYYRLYLPNNGPTAISDIFGNQLDGEFRGYQDSTGAFVTLLPNGQVRGNLAEQDLTGDGTAGGAFMTGFVVVPYGNVVHANANAVYNPQISSQTPNGSETRPFPVLAPEAVPNGVNGGDLNSSVNSGANFNAVYDRSGRGTFQPSAFFAAQQLVDQTGLPTVILAEASTPTRDPITGLPIQQPFVLQAPAGSDAIVNDASASVPDLTTLIFEPGSILKMQNAALLVQNQGSALQVLGGPNSFQKVTITSYKDSSVGGVTNGDPTSTPGAGDYGGIVFRNYDQYNNGAPRNSTFPGQIPLTGNSTLDGRLYGPTVHADDPISENDASSGADDIMSYVNNLIEKYAGGAVPQTNGIRYDGITIQNSRPTITNSSISFAGGQGSAQAGLSVDVDALRLDDVAGGPMLRNDTFIDNGLNGIYIRAQLQGVAQATNAVNYPINSSAQGGQRNYILDDPYPYLLTSRMVIGSRLQVETGGVTVGSGDRLYVSPGMMVKFEHGAALQISSATASINVGDTTYIKEYDQNHNVGPTTPTLNGNGVAIPFVANSSTFAKVLFTSLNDDTASTSFFDPIAQTTTTIVQPLPAVPGGSGALQPTAGNVNTLARWGGITIASGAVGVINSAVFRYGGGAINTAGGTGTQNVLNIGGGVSGAHVSITNDLFTDNAGAPILLNTEALLSADLQRPLLSGAPFIHGNVFQRNGFDAVQVDAPVIQDGDGFHESNLNVNSTWTGGDFTYIITNTIILGPPADGGLTNGFFNFNNVDGVPGLPSSTQYVQQPPASVTLTLQSTLAGTVLADGSVVAAPGVPLLVKELGAAVPLEAKGVSPAANNTSYWQGGAGFIAGVDDGRATQFFGNSPGERLVTDGGFSQIRILGIPANQSTGQARVPVIITSALDNTVGTTVNNVVMNVADPSNTNAPKAGDGGVIYFGGNSLTTYNLQDPRNGSIIDNADIRYITRIEQQGGGILYTYAFGTQTVFSPGSDPFNTLYDIKLGEPLGGNSGYSDQYNQAKQLTISNSNLSTFSDAGVIAHPGYSAIDVEVNYIVTNSPFLTRISPFLGEATHTYLVNDTISNMTAGQATGVEVISETADNINIPSPAMAVLLNDTFYNDGTGVNLVGMNADGINDLSHVSALVMDSIFSNITNDAVDGSGQLYGSDLQYNLYNQVGGKLAVNVGNDQFITGNPAFRDPANGNFALLSTSAAIDRARSELGPSIFGDMLQPATTIDTTNINAIPIRNGIGASNPFGGLGFVPSPTDIVTLPGEPILERGFPDQWLPTINPVASPTTVVTTSSNLASLPGTGGVNTTQANYTYVPIIGERDQAGNLRVKDPNSPNVGFGSRPFFDLGAFEYIIQNPPVVTAVAAFVANAAAGINLYKPGGIAGSNQLPRSIQVTFNERLDPATINGNSVVLLASGGDGIFGNANSPSDRAISLAGKLSFNANTNTLTIDTSGIFTNVATANDEYELVLKGTGSSVIKDNSGLALDGYTANDTIPLPSGSDQFPGSDFLVNFTIDTNPPSLVVGSFKLNPASDSSGGLNITNNTKPSFIGTITDIFPPVNPVVGDQVFVDISTKGDGNFDLLNYATGTTDTSGNFVATATSALPVSNYNVGPDGIQGTLDDTGATFARVRIIDPAGNVSILPSASLATFVNAGATTVFQVDTTPPEVTSFSPASNVLLAPAANGQITITATFTKNLKASTLNANSVLVYRAGGSGVFNGNGIQVPIDPSSFKITYLHTPKGAIQVTFNTLNATALPNDLYRIVLKGTGATPITDLAGNALDGADTGTPGSDFVNGPFLVYTPANSRLIYVENGVGAVIDPTATLGSRLNPYATIGLGMAAARTGDDVLVLPGTYIEDVTLKPQVRLLSADPTSTDSGFLPGNPLATLIYGVPTTTTTNGVVTTSSAYAVSGTNITAIPGIPTEVSGFAIIDALLGDPVHGAIDPASGGVVLNNASVLVDRNYIVNGGFGVYVATTGVKAPTPQITDNVIAGNIYGVGIFDLGSTTSITAPTTVYNNTITDNTVGVYNVSSTPGVTQAYILNDIFYSNHDLTTARNGTGIYSTGANTLGVGYDLFYQNGPTNAPASNAIGSFTGFNPAALSATPDAFNNILGDPAFVSPRDPRPNGDSPPVFFLDGNYDLTARSPAINAAAQSVAPATDIRYRTPVRVAGKGFPGTGPASIGAFYYNGTGGIVITGGNGTITGTTGTTGSTTTGSKTGSGGTTRSIHSAAVLDDGSANPMIGGSLPIGTKQFNVVSATPSSSGSGTAPTSITVDFSDNIDRSTLSASDLVVSGSGVKSARVSGFSWVDSHTVKFLLAGDFNASGQVNATIPQGAIKDTAGDALVGFSGTIQGGSVPISTTTTTTTTTNPASATSGTTIAPAIGTAAASVVAVPQTAVVQPIAVAGPIAVDYGTSKSTKHAATSKKTVKAASVHKTTAHHETAKPAAHKAAAKPAVHKAAAKPAKHTKGH